MLLLAGFWLCARVVMFYGSGIYLFVTFCLLCCASLFVFWCFVLLGVVLSCFVMLCLLLLGWFDCFVLFVLVLLFGFLFDCVFIAACLDLDLDLAFGWVHVRLCIYWIRRLSVAEFGFRVDCCFGWLWNCFTDWLIVLFALLDFCLNSLVNLILIHFDGFTVVCFV